ncbi:MAG: thioesterase [Halanaerobiales bacterium]|nr:thioesterase [Halanaerobiales bacterium]
MKLFCLPYAGGSAVVYYNWKKYIDSKIEICPVELAGRGKRIRSSYYSDFNEMVKDVYDNLKRHLNEMPYAIFGHSMGSWLAFELAHRIMEEGYENPCHLFFSARRAPQIYKDELNFQELSCEEIQHVLFELGGTPRELLENKDMLNQFLPILKSDFKVMSTYKYVEKKEKFPYSISILSGTEDKDISTSDLLAWKKHSQIGCKINKISGGHFFINDNIKDVTNYINNTLLG